MINPIPTHFVGNGYHTGRADEFTGPHLHNMYTIWGRG